MKTWTIKYNTDGYNSPLPERAITVRAATANNALASALKTLSYQQGIRRGAIADAKRDGGRVLIGRASYNRNQWAWVEEERKNEKMV